MLKLELRLGPSENHHSVAGQFFSRSVLAEGETSSVHAANALILTSREQGGDFSDGGTVKVNMDDTYIRCVLIRLRLLSNTSSQRHLWEAFF
jgi:hypothetical protein